MALNWRHYSTYYKDGTPKPPIQFDQRRRSLASPSPHCGPHHQVMREHNAPATANRKALDPLLTHSLSRFKKARNASTIASPPPATSGHPRPPPSLRDQSIAPSSALRMQSGRFSPCFDSVDAEEVGRRAAGVSCLALQCPARAPPRSVP